MSTARRRPTGPTRRPQVAGRPRGTTAPAESESAETADGALAVEERTETRTAPGSPAAGGRTRTVTRPGTRRDEDGTDLTPSRTAEPSDAPEADPDTAGDRGGSGTEADPESGTDSGTDSGAADSETALPAAPAVRSGESDATAGTGTGLVGRLRRIPLPQAPSTRRGTAALLAVTILLVAAAGFFAVSWARLQFSGATGNTALSDVGTTATVSEQVGEAVTKVYSFDFARLDQAESDARAVITGPFTGQFDQIFGNVRQLAPKQQAVVTATIPKSAVASIDGDRASVYVFVNQVVRRVDDGGKPQQGTAAARLRVDAEYVDGRWKVSGMTPA